MLRQNRSRSWCGLKQFDTDHFVSIKADVLITTQLSQEINMVWNIRNKWRPSQHIKNTRSYGNHLVCSLCPYCARAAAHVIKRRNLCFKMLLASFVISLSGNATIEARPLDWSNCRLFRTSYYACESGNLQHAAGILRDSPLSSTTSLPDMGIDHVTPHLAIGRAALRSSYFDYYNELGRP